MKKLEELLSISEGVSILYAEDDEALRQSTASILRDLKFCVHEVCDGKKGLEAYEKKEYDIVLTDLNMPFMNGMDLIREVHRIHPEQVAVVVSAYNETEFFIESIRNNISGYILKPVDFELLIDTLYNATALVKLHQENRLYKENLQDMVKEKTQALEESYASMHDFLTIDKVTGLENATMLYHYLDTITPKTMMSVMLYRIDHFNAIVQSYGHDYADRLLACVAGHLRLNVSTAKIFKYNASEFVILFDAFSYDVTLLLEQIRAFFQETPVGEENNTMYITLSCGVSHFDEPKGLLPRARIALQEALKKGLSAQSCVYEDLDTSVEDSLVKMSWIQKLRQALEEDRVIPFFHPIVDNTTQQIVSYECLARIEEEGTLISPESFLDAARNGGLLGNITRIMIHKCFSLFQKRAIVFSINITQEDLLNEGFYDYIVHKQETLHIDPRYVVLEILEDVILHPLALRSIERLKALGYKIALDDFGSDRSSFNRFGSIAIDYIKIDGHFIRGLHENSEYQVIVQSIVRMAHKMGMKVVAEFVSNEDDFKSVKHLGVDYSQGYYFSLPLKTC